MPAVLRLVQQAVLSRWQATSEDLYRGIVRLTGLTAGHEIVISGCGDGAITEWFAQRIGAAVTGVDPDRAGIAAAEARSRELQLDVPIHYESAPLDDLPHEDAVFDVAVGAPALSAAVDPSRAVAELARVTKPMGWVVLLQPTWSSEISADARDPIADRLGMRPHLLVEWKQMLRDAGVVEIQVQDWTDAAPGSSGRKSGSFELPLLGWSQKVLIVTNALRRLGWRQARAVLDRESELLRELTRERAIGFQLVGGVKWHFQEAQA